MTFGLKSNGKISLTKHFAFICKNVAPSRLMKLQRQPKSLARLVDADEISDSDDYDTDSSKFENCSELENCSDNRAIPCINGHYALRQISV